EKYDEEVRVGGMGGFSTELCGGTHVERTGDIGLFKILSEGGIAAGIRRIEAITGEGALSLISEQESKLDQVAGLLKAESQHVTEAVRSLVERSKSLEKELARLAAQIAGHQVALLADEATLINGTKVVVATVTGIDPKALRDTMNQMKVKLNSGVALLATVSDGKVSLVAGVTDDLVSQVKAGELVSLVATAVGGKGGGRPDLAMAGGSDAAALPAALEQAQTWLATKL
ncbi:MAG: DHHA1 domain-containing protein, partial [Ferrimonas sp.]